MPRYIDAEALDALLREAYFEYKDKEKKAKSDIEAEAASGTAYGITGCRMALLNAPTADVQEVKHGQWLDNHRGGDMCSVCGYECDDAYYLGPYCQNCGAKMDGRICNA